MAAASNGVTLRYEIEVENIIQVSTKCLVTLAEVSVVLVVIFRGFPGGFHHLALLLDHLLI